MQTCKLKVFFLNGGLSASQLDKGKRLDWRMRVSTERQRGAEMESERDPRCCEALPSRCLASLSLIGLPPPSLPPSSSLPLAPSLPAVTRAMRLLVLPPPSSLSPCLPPNQAHPPSPPSPRQRGLAKAREKLEEEEEQEEQQQILIHLMAPVLPQRLIRAGTAGLGGAGGGRQAGGEALAI